ncbi:MAG: hypothetical protein IH586_10080, partial [Anaerolineaceae bacterium]|nr:hypothetical protein [Anaerolineaceae bacterium]
GFIHIGSIYISLIGRQLTRQSGGVWILRIEDTDQQREIERGVEQIVESLRSLPSNQMRVRCGLTRSKSSDSTGRISRASARRSTPYLRNTWSPVVRRTLHSRQQRKSRRSAQNRSAQSRKPGITGLGPEIASLPWKRSSAAWKKGARM